MGHTGEFMPGLLDIAPPEIVTERFDIRGGFLDVRALRNRERAMLQARFPGLGSNDDAEKALAFIGYLPAAIAAAAGQIGNSEIEAAIVERLSDDEMGRIFDAIMRLTNPPDPLAESPVAAGQSNGKAETTSPTPSNS